MIKSISPLALIVLLGSLSTTGAYAAVTERYKLTAAAQTSEEGIFLVTNKGEFAFQSMIVKNSVLTSMGRLKRGNCFTATSSDGLANTDGDAIQKIKIVPCK